MINNYRAAFKYAIEELDKMSIKYEVHKLPSGAVMMDIWIGNLFYVLQFEENYIGVSEVNDENPGFDTVPDERFHDIEKFKIKLNTLLLKGNG